MESRLRFRGRRLAFGLLVVAGLLGFGAWSALAQSVITPTTPNPLPGSQFQGGDGNQDDVPGLIDWQGLQADGRVSHTSDPQSNDNIFTGGSKELEPGQWGITTENGGATPGKANILDLYRALDHPPAGDVFLYLAFTRFAGDGTTFLTFELNQDPRTWTNSAGSTIPCRTTGDILITFDQNGNSGEVQVDRWVTDTADATTGCAKTGHLVAASGLTPNVDVQGSFNSAAPINNYLPGFFPLGTNTIPTAQFGEAAINLTTVLGGLGQPCSVFGSTWAHSRSSTSDTSSMQDYVAPQPFHVRTCKANPALTSVASGQLNRRAHRHRLRRHRTLSRTLGVYDTAVLSGGDSPTGTLTFNLFGPDDPGCRGTPIFTDTATANGNGAYQSGSFTPTSAGTYRWVVDYSGDDNNNPAGPTACGDDAETIVVSPASPTLSSVASGPTRSFTRRSPRPPHHPLTVRLHTGRAAQSIYDSAVLGGGLAPTGTIRFDLYGPNDATCSGPPVFTSTASASGNGTYTSDPFTPSAAGTYRWVVTYSGDANNHPAGPTACGDPNETVVISPAQPTISTVASGAVDLGNPISDSATLTGGTDPTGTITFRSYGPDDDRCTGTPADTSTATVSGNGTYASRPFTPTEAGTYQWVASYSGDARNDPASTSCGDAGEAVVVARPVAQPTLASTASPSRPAGSPITDTAHLSGGTDPTGTTSFRVYGPDDPSCAGPPADTSTVTVRGNGDYTSAPFVPAQAGIYRWIAGYSGDATNRPAGPTTCGDAAETVTVTRAQPRLITLAVPAATLPHTTRDTAVLSGASDPRGRIVFELFGPNDDTCSSPPVFTSRQNVVGNGGYSSASFAPSNPGTYRWVASYSGDTNNNSAATHCGDRGEVTAVLPARPFLSTSASPPAYLNKGRRTRAAGSSIYDSARLRRGVGPTGRITFDLYGPDDTSCSRLPVFTTATTVNGNGIYNSESFTPTASGTYRWVATYSGDANNRSAGPTGCGDPAEQIQVTVPADVQLTTTASDAVMLGGAVSDTAHLSGGAAPTGTLTFHLYGPDDTTCAGSPVFTSTVAVNGNGDYTSQSFVPVPAGEYRWIVNYSGDRANHPAGPTACGEAGETVIVRPSDITPVLIGLSTTASPPPEAGGVLYDTALLSGGVDPGGAITFELFGPEDPTCVGTPAFVTSVAVDGNGEYRSAPFVASAPGTYRWVATYSGDALNSPAGPTTCGIPGETATVTAAAGAPDVGPNVPTPPPPKKATQAKKAKKAKRHKRKVGPGFTG